MGAVDPPHVQLMELAVDRRSSAAPRDQREAPPGLPEHRGRVIRTLSRSVGVERAVRVPGAVHLREEPDIDDLPRLGDRLGEADDVVVVAPARNPGRRHDLFLAARRCREAEHASGVGASPPVQRSSREWGVPVVEVLQQRGMRADPGPEGTEVCGVAGVRDAVKDAVMGWRIGVRRRCGRRDRESRRDGDERCRTTQAPCLTSLTYSGLCVVCWRHVPWFRLYVARA